MKTREQNRNNKRKEIERFDWFLTRIQTRVRFDWLKERSGEKTLCPRTRVKNAVRMRAFPASGANLHVPPPIEIIRDTKTN